MSDGTIRLLLADDQALVRGALGALLGLEPDLEVVAEVATGDAVLAAQAMGADFAYIGTAFIATEEARASDDYKRAIVEGNSDDIVYSNLFTGVHGNYLAPSIVAAGMDPANLPQGDLKTMNFASGEGSKAKAWKDIWGSGQGIGAIGEVTSAAAYIEKLKQQYQAARQRLAL